MEYEEPLVPDSPEIRVPGWLAAAIVFAGVVVALGWIELERAYSHLTPELSWQLWRIDWLGDRAILTGLIVSDVFRALTIGLAGLASFIAFIKPTWRAPLVFFALTAFLGLIAVRYVEAVVRLLPFPHAIPPPHIIGFPSVWTTDGVLVYGMIMVMMWKASGPRALRLAVATLSLMIAAAAVVVPSLWGESLFNVAGGIAFALAVFCGAVAFANFWGYDPLAHVDTARAGEPA
jgi:hypothetical protein